MEDNNSNIPNNKQSLSAARYLRNFKGLSLEQAAKKIHVQYPVIMKLELGRGINLGNLRRIAQFYKVSLDCLARSDLTAAASQLTSRAIRSNRRKTAIREIQHRRDSIGDIGERIIIERERKRLAGTRYELAVNGNASDDVTAGFDVLSFTAEGVPIYIEVKTTVLGKDDDFYISRGELEFARSCRARGLLYQLHRVYQLNEQTGECSVVVFSASELLRCFDFQPVNYKVRRVCA